MESFETGLSGFRLRFAERGDTAVVLKFIRDLAVYENELDQVTATEEVLCDSLFERKAAEVLLGEYEGRTVGFALFFQSFSTFLGRPTVHLVDLYVEPDVRGKGFGKKILACLARITRERGCDRLEWWCHDWNELSIRLYKRWGAFPLENIRVYRLCKDALAGFAAES